MARGAVLDKITSIGFVINTYTKVQRNRRRIFANAPDLCGF
jgi:hypothetical protein